MSMDREQSRRAILADLAPAVHDQATADMAASIADEFSRHGITGIEFAGPEPAGLVPGETEWRYEVSAGIRPPRRSGRVRGVAYAVEPGGGMEIWHCEHDHAPGVHDMRNVPDAQREDAYQCAERWLEEQMARGARPRLPVVRES